MSLSIKNKSLSIKNKKKSLSSKNKKSVQSIQRIPVDLTKKEKKSFFEELDEIETLIQSQITIEYPITVQLFDEDIFWNYFGMIANRYNITKLNRTKYLTTLNFIFNGYLMIYELFQLLYNDQINPRFAKDEILEIKRFAKVNNVFVTKSFANFLETLINHLNSYK